MRKTSKRVKKFTSHVEQDRQYSLVEAIGILKECPGIKFDQSIDIAVKMGVDPRKSDQQVRGTVSLPHGTGKTLRVLAFAVGDKQDEAKAAGAEFVGSDELFEKVKGGWTDFDVVVATPDMMRKVGQLGRVLGPRGLMPTPKAGTVTTDIKKAIEEVKGGKIEFKADRHGVCNNAVGKLSFTVEALLENVQSLLQAIVRARPVTAKGQYIPSVALSSTMGPGLKINLSEVPT